MTKLLNQAQQLKAMLWGDNSHRRGMNLLRVPIAAFITCWRSNWSQKAAALTFSTMLAFVPLLAIMFALLKGFGVHNAIEPLLIKHLSIGSEEVVSRIVEYINNTNVARLGSVGLVMLVFTVLGLISSIEKSFNSSWKVAETRTLFRRFTDYFSVVTLGPLFLFAAISMNTFIRNQYVVQWILDKPVFGDLLMYLFEVLPFVAIWLAFIFLYLFVPNTKINIISATLAGICAGSLWLFTQWSYVNFQYGVAKYNAIYGTMAALPIFMVWIYVSWLIVLLGLQLCWAHQNRLRLGRLLQQCENVRWQPLQVLELLLLIYNRFVQAKPCWQVDELLDQVEMPEEVAHAGLDHLERYGVVLQVEKDDDKSLVLPQIPIEKLSLPAILQLEIDVAHLSPEVLKVAEQLQAIRREYIGRLSLEKLIDSR
ncbi:MAG: ribonuclease BN [Desulfobacteraceae bacterium 4572_35.1]|nr:MAG: ribonuclease BN [Desulfobacteraceae bacterium 4572_35.1]